MLTKWISLQCVYRAKDDRKGPQGFTDEACGGAYGQGFQGTCTRQGGKAGSICSNSYGCPVIDTAQSECKAPNDVYTPCTYVTCVRGELSCGQAGTAGLCTWGKCLCGADGRWNLTERYNMWSNCPGMISR